MYTRKQVHKPANKAWFVGFFVAATLLVYAVITITSFIVNWIAQGAR